MAFYVNGFFYVNFMNLINMNVAKLGAQRPYFSSGSILTWPCTCIYCFLLPPCCLWWLRIKMFPKQTYGPCLLTSASWMAYFTISLCYYIFTIPFLLTVPFLDHTTFHWKPSLQFLFPVKFYKIFQNCTLEMCTQILLLGNIPQAKPFPSAAPLTWLPKFLFNFPPALKRAVKWSGISISIY